jgi:hypothetical protein
MGYRSDVAYLIKFKDADKWNVFMLEAKAKEETRMCFDDADLKVDHENQRIMFHVEGVKWYDSYEDVQCHQKLLELCVDYNNRFENDAVCSYEFYRIGENMEDIQEDTCGYPDYEIRLVRHMEVPW